MFLFNNKTKKSKPPKPKIERMPWQKKKVSKITIAVLGILTVFALYVAAALGAAFDLSAATDGSIDVGLLSKNIAVTLANPDMVITALKVEDSYAPKMAFAAFAVVGIWALYKYSMVKKRLHRKGVEHGSAKFGDEKEMQSLKDNGGNPKKHTPPKFVPALTSDGKRVFGENNEFVGFMIDNNIILTKEVYMSLNSRQHLMNLNVLIIGGSGSGKTRFYAKPNIMCLNTSFCITDPKGEILQSVGKMLVEAGYQLRVLNTIEMEHSNNYNPFHYVYDYNGNLSEDNVTKMIDVFMQNTKGEGEKDDFWSQSAMKTITAIIFLLFEESEYHGELDENGIIRPETRDKSQLNFYSVTAKMRKLSYPPSGTKDGYFFIQEKGESDEDYKKRREEAFLCQLDYDFIELERRKGETLAVRLYKEIRNSPQETGQSIIATAGARTQMFNLKAVSNLTCCDNIQLETLGDRKTALFVIISATNATYNFLAAMMYTQLFDVLANRANFKYGGMLPIHVRCIMDEFANVGQIPDFDKVIAFVRSMGMSLNVIIQNLAQLKARYEKTWEIITGNCDSMLFLGGKEASTLKDISESLGKETIDIESKNHTVSGGHKSDSTAESNSIVGRELLTPDELQKMPISNCILMIRSHNPFYCNKFPIEQHPNFKFTEDFDKKNTFDKYSIKVKTLQEFESEFSKGEPVTEKSETGTPNESTQEKWDRKFPKPDAEEPQVTSISVNLDYESFAEVEEFSEKVNSDIAEEFADLTEDYPHFQRYGLPNNETESFEMGEADPNYTEFVFNDSEDSEGGEEAEYSDYADCSENEIEFAVPAEEPEYADVEGGVECHLARQAVTNSLAISCDDYGLDLF